MKRNIIIVSITVLLVLCIGIIIAKENDNKDTTKSSMAIQGSNYNKPGLKTGNVKISDLSASVDLSSKTVTISGVISSGGGNDVSVKVTAPDGNLDYVYQAVSETGGKFKVTYITQSQAKGTFTVNVGGKGISKPYQTSFEYNPS